MAKEKETLEMYLTQEQIDYIQSLPEEERQQATEDLLGIKRFKNGAVDLTTVPGKTGDFFRKKELLLNPERVRDEEGLRIKRYGDEHYFECTCPYCGTTAEHEGAKYHFSKKTKGLLIRDGILLGLIALATSLRILNLILALVAVTLLTVDIAKHAQRKMYYTVRCRKCGAPFPLDEEELEKLKADLAAAAQAEAEAAQEEPEEAEEPEEEQAPEEYTEEE